VEYNGLRSYQTTGQLPVRPDGVDLKNCFIMNPHYRRLRFSFAGLLLAGLALVPNLGCDKIVERRAMPAPLREPAETTIKGRITKIQGGDNFEFISGKETHYLLLRGLDAPNPGAPFFNESKHETHILARKGKKEVTVHVFERDEVMHEIVEISVPVGKTEGDFESDEFDLGIELIKRGWARYNGASFDGAERLIEAEASAKERKVGIWAEPKETSTKKSNSNDKK